MRILIYFFSLSLLFLASSVATADGGGGGGMGSSCRINIGDFTFMFSAYQPQLSGDTKFCTQMTGLGRTNLVLDYEDKEGSVSVGEKRALDKEIKKMKVGVEVIRPADGKVLVDIPPKPIRGGILETIADFPEKGDYELHIKLVDENGNEVGENHVPLRVGIDSGSQMRMTIIVATVLFALIYLMYLSSAPFKEKVDGVLAKLKKF